jgi:hypothetical protein
MAQLFVNNLIIAITADITATQVTIDINDNSRLPVLGPGDWFNLTIVEVSRTDEIAWEVVKVTSWSANTLTVVRAQDNTSGRIWAIGSKMSLRVTANDIGGKIRADNYATETVGGTIKVRLDVDTLYMTTDGSNP